MTPSIEHYQKVVEAVNQALSDGFPLKGNATSGPGAAAAAAEKLGIPRRTLLDQLRTAKLNFNLEPGKPVGEIKKAEKAEKATKTAVPVEKPPISKEMLSLRDQNRVLRAELADIQRQNLTCETIREAIFGLTKVDSHPPKWVYTPASKLTPGIPSLLLTDFHWGETVHPDQIQGVNNVFGLKVAQERLKLLGQKVLKLCFDEFAHPEYPGIVLMLGGDLFSGMIHEELTETNEVRMPAAFVDLFDHMIAFIELMLEHFPLVWIVGVVGNHPRLTRKPRAKFAAQDNWDWLLYTMLERHFVRSTYADRIKFNVPSGPDAYFDIYGHTYLLTHGDKIGVRGGDGQIGALGPILRGALKIRSQYAAVNRPIRTVVMGHWHSDVPFHHLIVGPTLKGYDEWTFSMRFTPETPAQKLWWTHPEHGITFMSSMFVGPHPNPLGGEGVPGWAITEAA